MLFRDLLELMRKKYRETNPLPMIWQADEKNSKKNWFGYDRVPSPLPAGIWKWFKIRDNTFLPATDTFYGRLFNPAIEYAGAKLYAFWNDTVGQNVAISNDGGASWGPPISSAPSVDDRGGTVLRGSKIDLYVNDPPAGTSALYIKRFTFDGLAWEAPVTVHSKVDPPVGGIGRPYPFRDPADNSRRGMIWIEGEVVNEQQFTADVSENGADANYPDPQPTQVSWTPSGNGGSISMPYTWEANGNDGGSPPRNFYKLKLGAQDFALNVRDWDFLLRNFLITIAGIEVNVTVSITGGADMAIEYDDASTMQVEPVAGTLRTLIGELKINLLNPGGVAKALTAGTATYGSPTDLWGANPNQGHIHNSGSGPDFGIHISSCLNSAFIVEDPAEPLLKIYDVAGSPPSTPANINVTITVNWIKVYFGTGILYYGTLDASGDLTGITVLDNAIYTGAGAGGYFDPATGEPVVSWEEGAFESGFGIPGTDDLVHRRIRVGGVWQAETTHAFSDLDFGDQIPQFPGGLLYSSFPASRKETNMDWAGLRFNGFGFNHTYRRVVGGAGEEEAYADLRDPEVANPAPGAEAAIWTQLTPAATQPSSDFLALIVTSDGSIFDLWFLTREDAL